MKAVPVPLSQNDYVIYIGSGVLSSFDEDVVDQRPSVFFITDEHVVDYARQLQQRVGDRVSHMVVVPAGEATKLFSSYESVVDQLLEKSIQRKSLIVAVGGGVVGDLAGFVAATVLRGVDFIQVPTTLLSMVDSSVGGKTGINSKHGKNLVGAFYQPKEVLVDIDVLKTLPDREMRAGYAEIVKYGLLGNKDFFEWLEVNGRHVLARDDDALLYAIETSCRMKADIVCRDEKETTGLRAQLNLGHTFGHALEAAAGYDGRLLHGEAVSIGMVLAARLSVRLKLISCGDAQRVEAHLKSCGLMTEIRDIPNFTTSVECLLSSMAKDKKVTASGIGFIVLKSLGASFTKTDVPMDYVVDILRESM